MQAVFIGYVNRQRRRYTAGAAGHGGLPVMAYAGFLAAAALLPRNPETGLLVVGASALLLLFVGIHNAWDAVIYLALRGSQKEG